MEVDRNICGVEKLRIIQGQEKMRKYLYKSSVETAEKTRKQCIQAWCEYSFCESLPIYPDNAEFAAYYIPSVQVLQCISTKGMLIGLGHMNLIHILSSATLVRINNVINKSMIN